MAVVMRLGVGLAVVVSALSLAGCEAARPSSSFDGAPGDAVANARTHTLVAGLRERFEVSASTTASPAQLAVGRELALLPASEAIGFAASGNQLKPEFPAEIEPRAATQLARAAGELSTIREVSRDSGRTGLALSFRVHGAAQSSAATADGYLSYENALPHATLVSRPSSEGIEDYVYFEQAPKQAELRYDLEPSPEVAGLRLVANQLEALDPSGTPRLRVAPPFLIDANKNRIDARLAVEGCAADTDPAPPWDRPVTPPGAAHCSIVITWNDASVSYPALLDPSWSTTGSMAAARAFHTSTPLSTGKVLVVGGIGSGGVPIATAELYNNAGSGTWAATASVPTTSVGRAYHTASILNDGTVFVAGGYKDATTTTHTTAIYTPASGTWVSKAQMVTDRGRHAATVLTSGEVVITGGISGTTTTVQNVEVYRPTGVNADTWFAANSPTSARRASHTSVRMSSGDVMIMGGRDGSTTLSSAFSYHLATNTWTARGNLSEPRVGHTATTLSSGKILVTGGGPFNSTTVVATCDLYDNAANVWRTTADMVSARSGHAATLMPDGRVLVSGGIGPGSSALAIKTAERFKPTWETWTEEASLNAARAFHTASVVPSTNTVVAAGGITKTASPAYLASAERVTPVTNTVNTSDYFDGAHALWSPDLPEINASDDPQRTTRSTELKGTMYYPNLAAGVSYPLVVMMHGNHATCGTGSNPHIDDNSQYSGTSVDTGGTCPAGHFEVRSDKGFAYLATELAERGFFVVSIDANRGLTARSDGEILTDQTLVKARGRLMLKTLQHMSQWNAGTRATPAGLPNLTGHLNLHDTILFGHSRGGESVRNGDFTYRNDSSWAAAIPDLQIAGIFEIGSTNGELFQSGSMVADGQAPYALVMGTCDTNVLFSNDNILPTGAGVFDYLSRNSISFAAQYFVVGANHNYYNTEWQMSDVDFRNDGTSKGDGAVCLPAPIYQAGGPGSGITGSAKQRQTAVTTLLHFATMWGQTFDETQLGIFNPINPAPPALKVLRSYSRSEGSHTTLEEFPTAGSTSSSWGIPFQLNGVTALQNAQPYEWGHSHWQTLSAENLVWTTASSSNFFETDWAGSGSGFDFTNWGFLEFRLDRDPANPASAATNFSVKLANGNGTFSSGVQIANYLTLTGQSGITRTDQESPGPVFSRALPLPTVRIPFSAFGGATLSSVRGVRLVFDQSASGTIWLTEVRASSDP